MGRKWRSWETCPITDEHRTRFNDLVTAVAIALRARGLAPRTNTPDLSYLMGSHGTSLVVDAGDDTHSIWVRRFDHKQHGLMVEVAWGWSISRKKRIPLDRATTADVADLVVERVRVANERRENDVAYAEAKAQLEEDAGRDLGFKVGRSRDLEITPARTATGGIEYQVRLSVALVLSAEEVRAFIARHKLDRPTC